MKLTIIYFAAFRDLAGRSEEELDNIPSEIPVRELQELVHKKHPSLTFEGVRVAVNEEFVDEDHLLQNADVVAYIPPVSGG